MNGKIDRHKLNYLYFVFGDDIENFMTENHPEALWDDSEDLIVQHLKEVNPEEFI
jgi:hypothetical protein